MFMVYWIEIQDEIKNPQCQQFDTDQMTLALKRMEALRKTQREIGGVSHITMSSENPNSVGLPGVDITGDDYNWKKRRI